MRERVLKTRFFSKVQVSPDTECLVWKAAISGDGYGSFSHNSSMRCAHRVGYELLVGPVPEGMELDHLCRNRACVNPNHLEPVTPRENMRRVVIARFGASPAECTHGHAYTEASTYTTPNGKKRCRPCNAAAQARRKARVKS